MSAFNKLVISTECPNCKTYTCFEAEFKFGFTKLDTYAVGEKIQWGKKGVGHSRPKDGNYIGDGYIECPICHKDFWINIFVIDDKISYFQINLNKAGYI